MVSSSRSVIFDIAETTTTTGRFPLSPATISAAARIRSAEPTLVPPNFITSRSFTQNPFPFESFARITRRMASSTSTGVRPVESM
jgi:hypothetical protein